jgi:hypothetical protein
VIKALESALNELYPGAAPYGPALYKIIKIENATEMDLTTNLVGCTALVTTGNGKGGDDIERDSYGMLNASHVTNRTSVLTYTYGTENGRAQLQIDFNGMRKNAPL